MGYFSKLLLCVGVLSVDYANAADAALPDKLKEITKADPKMDAVMKDDLNKLTKEFGGKAGAPDAERDDKKEEEGAVDPECQKAAQGAEQCDVASAKKCFENLHESFEAVQEIRKNVEVLAQKVNAKTDGAKLSENKAGTDFKNNNSAFAEGDALYQKCLVKTKDIKSNLDLAKVIVTKKNCESYAKNYEEMGEKHAEHESFCKQGVVSNASGKDANSAVGKLWESIKGKNGQTAALLTTLGAAGGAVGGLMGMMKESDSGKDSSKDKNDDDDDDKKDAFLASDDGSDMSQYCKGPGMAWKNGECQLSYVGKKDPDDVKPVTEEKPEADENKVAANTAPETDPDARSGGDLGGGDTPTSDGSGTLPSRDTASAGSGAGSGKAALGKDARGDNGKDPAAGKVDFVNNSQSNFVSTGKGDGAAVTGTNLVTGKRSTAVDATGAPANAKIAMAARGRAVKKMEIPKINCADKLQRAQHADFCTLEDQKKLQRRSSVMDQVQRFRRPATGN